MNGTDFPNSDEELELMTASVDPSKDVKPPVANASKSSFPSSHPISQSNDDFPDHDELDFIANELSKPRPNVQMSNRSQSPAKTGLESSTADEFPDTDEEFIETQPRPVTQSQPKTQRKRTFEELCRDMGEHVKNSPNQPNPDLVHPDFLIDFDAIGTEEKKPRWDQPEELIEILRQENRKRRQKQQEQQPSSPSQYLFEKQTKRETISLKIPPWNFIAVTRQQDSQRVYVRLKSKNPVELPKPQPTYGFLNINYQKVKEEAEKILMEKAARESVSIKNPPVSETTDDALWVDKYRPKSYMELLSDETVNRAFLHWIKLWNKIVFNKEPQNKPKKDVSHLTGRTKYPQKEEAELVDKNGIPIHKIAMLTGPPGLGKTTLAHLVAKQAGYNVVEINASDDRSSEAFRQALVSSTQMQSLMGADPRPNCLVFDEIDGAPATSIELLLKFIQGKLTAKKKTTSQSTAKNNDHCKRPVVCICNDAYAPALRSLRQMAYIINVPKISPSNLTDRLWTIARREHLKVNQSSLMQLAEKSGCDIRSCLGALQYLGSDCMKANVSLETKDMKKTVFEAWREILRIPVDRVGPLPFRERSKRILHVAYSDNSERLAQGVFENYPLNCHEKISAICSSLEWFQMFDKITTLVNSQQEWTVAGYTNYCFISWHFGFAGNLNPKLSFPHLSIEAAQKLNKTKAILAIAKKSRAQDIETLTLDVTPFLFELLNPKLRSVASNLYSAKEKQDLQRLIDTLLDLGISFIQEKTNDGAVDYQIEPNLFEVGIFPECKARRGLSYAVKQIIAQELEIERLRRAAIVTGASTSSDPRNKDKDGSGNSNKEIVQFIPSTSAFRPAHLNEMERIVTPKNNRCRNFFEHFNRPPPPTAKISPQSEKRGQAYRNIIVKYGVWFKYKEGYSNAIRRKLKLIDIL